MRIVTKEEALALLQRANATKSATTSALDCEACAQLSSEDDCHHIAASVHGLVVLNRFAHREGHMLVISRRHVEQVHELSWPEYADLQHLAHEASRVLCAVFSPARVYHAVLGSPAPLLISYPHLHVHVVPIAEADERARPARVFSWSDGVVVYTDHEATELARKLRAAWPTRRSAPASAG